MIVGQGPRMFAVIGAGPAGLMAAETLAVAGRQVIAAARRWP